jgi:hypothetical protein
LALCIAGKLARLRWTNNEVCVLIEAVATEAEDEELDDRLLAVDTTWKDIIRRKPSQKKEERLAELLGEGAPKHIHDWASPSMPAKPKSKGRDSL